MLHDASVVMRNNSFYVAKEAAAAPDVRYGMPITQGTFGGGPGTAETMIAVTKFHDVYYGQELPPRKDLYMPPQSTQAPPNTYQFSDTYISMNPARASVPEFSSRPPPPQYEASTVAMAADNESLYDEIPGEHQTPTFSEEKVACDDNQYVSIPSSSEANRSEVISKPQHTDEKVTNDPNEPDNAYVID